ncbi:hypothetical protein A7981_10220 [Methylovorus sp. MM2]|uniref:DUF2237 family protein n=1 Tax=Methylovorus sp. MM2 TaxID=1848038 RepID=UPI0007E28E47|nr:DUF2237 domain-containing protein [Methylovorus sp. MM2]OAM51828.1 hypothetical protein A7981_10220 [Methylovorus sp. MM2]
MAHNVIGTALQICSMNPLTGFIRNGCCETGPEDSGSHTVCAEVTEEFLVFSKAKGNDLSTPRPEYGFAGLKPGDRWCLCATRWHEAAEAGYAPPVVLEATHENALKIVSLADLKYHELR